nr:hypothetical protein [Myxococcales bacterium]
VAVISSTPKLAQAAPGYALFEGTLQTNGGGPVSDGNYGLTFHIHDGKAVKAAWSEGPVWVTVLQGRFAHSLGSKTPLPWATLAAMKAPELRIQVGKEAALPGVALHDSWIASSARSLACTGCVSLSQLKFDGDMNLGGNSIKAKNGLFTGEVTAGVVKANTFIGDGSKLTGINLPSGTCKAGQAVTGVGGDGSLVCASLAKSLPNDGLEQLSNGTLSNQFGDSYGMANNLAIPDNTGSAATVNVTVEDIGTAVDLQVRVKVQNTDLSKVSMTLLPPNDKKTGMTLCDPCGIKDAKALDITYSKDKGPASGDLGSWVGKNPKGLWTLKVLDADFCVPQKPGNKDLCSPNNGTDGQVQAFDVNVKTLANSKLQAKGALITTAGIQLSVLAKAPVLCSAKTRGMMYVDSATDQLLICRKTGLWGNVVINECGNKKIETGESCDDGNVKSGDGCDALCQNECGNGKVEPAEQCDPKDPATGAKCSSDCKLIKYGKLWLETPDYRFYPVKYPHQTYSESKAVALCKSVGLRLWRDESGSKNDTNWAYDYNNNHNLGGHDICYKINDACNGNQQGHTGTWKLFTANWSNDIKEISGGNNGSTVYVLNHLHHSGTNESSASWCSIRPQSSSVQWLSASNGSVNVGNYAVVLCSEGK